MGQKKKNNNYVGSKGYIAKEEAKKAKAEAERKHKLVVMVSLILAGVLFIGACFGIAPIAKAVKTNTMGTGTADHSLMDRSIEGRNIKYAEFTIKNYGKFVVLLDATAAPKTVENFVKLVNEGFYDGLTFHRAMSSIIQGGDPEANGTGGYTDENGKKVTVPGEYPTGIKHVAGTISMARGTTKDSASSQFFICTSTVSSWDSSYTSFGYVVEGMSVIEDVNEDMMKTLDGEGDTIENVKKQPVIKSVKILDNYTFTPHVH